MNRAATLATASAMASPGRVLIVEDQYFVAIDCEMSLQSAGLECVGLATSSDEALQLASDHRPDLVLMDIRLAGPSDGVQAAINIFRELGIRSIFTSGHADAAVREQAREAKPLGWLSKPYTNAQLLSAVERGLCEVGKTACRRQSPEDPAYRIQL
jgi:two-component system, response regulator PdtaR